MHIKVPFKFPIKNQSIKEKKLRALDKVLYNKSILFKHR